MKNEVKNEMTGYPSIDKPWLKYYSKTVEEFSPKTIYEYATKTLTQRYNEDLSLIHISEPTRPY